MRASFAPDHPPSAIACSLPRAPAPVTLEARAAVATAASAMMKPVHIRCMTLLADALHAVLRALRASGSVALVAQRVFPSTTRMRAAPFLLACLGLTAASCATYRDHMSAGRFAKACSAAKGHSAEW